MIKDYEKQLLSRLHYDESENNNVPLKNVREALGRIGFVKGNPLTKTEITINVRMGFTKDNVLINPALLPPELQVPLSVYLLGLTDYYSQYAKEKIIIQKPVLWSECLVFPVTNKGILYGVPVGVGEIGRAHV